MNQNIMHYLLVWLSTLQKRDEMIIMIHWKYIIYCVLKRRYTIQCRYKLHVYILNISFYILNMCFNIYRRDHWTWENKVWILFFQDVQDQECHTFATSCFTQFRILFVRTLLSILRDTVKISTHRNLLFPQNSSNDWLPKHMLRIMMSTC